MKKKLNDLLLFIKIILFVYVLISIIHLSWYIANPEGVFGFNYFVEIVKVVVTIIMIFVFVLMGIGLFINSLYSIIKNGFNKKELYKTTGMTLVIIIIIAFNHAWIGGISFFVGYKLSEKYRDIQITDDYLKNGEFEDALEYSNRAYEKEKERNIGSLFYFTKLYSQTAYDKKQKLLSNYAATINYGYCLKETLKSNETGKEKFEEAVSIAMSPLLEQEQSNLLIFPTLSLAEINLNKGNLKKADKYFQDLYNLHNASETEDVKYLIETNLIFSERASRIGDFHESIRLQKECLEIYEKSELSKESTDYASLLLLVAAGELYNQNYSKVSNLLTRVATLVEEKDKKPVYLDFLSIKGQYCFLAALNKQGNEDVIEKSFWDNFTKSSENNLSLEDKLIKESEKCYKELVERAEDLSGRESYNYLISIKQLANFYYQTVQFELAKPLFAEALTIIEPLKDENKDLYYEIYLKTISIKSFQSDFSINELHDVEDFIFDKIFENFLFLTEEEKEKYILSIEKRINFINTLYIRKNSIIGIKRLYNNVIGVKNIALFSNSNFRNFLKTSDNDLKTEYFELKKIKRELSLDLSHNERIQVIEKIRNKQRGLIEKVHNDSRFEPSKPKDVNWLNIRGALKENEVAIEIINIPISFYPKFESEYYALLIEPDSKSPNLIPLFKESELFGLLNADGNTKARVNTIYEKNNKKLFELILGPLEPLLSYDSRVFLSKSGILHNISFPALLNDKTWEIRVLGSTRQIIELNNTNKSNRIGLFGGIDYSNSLNQNSKKSESMVRSNRSFKNKFPYLKFTKIEVQNIDSLFQNYPSKNSDIFIEENASESVFRGISDSEEYDILHLATHGYYYGNKFSNPSMSGNANYIQHESSSLLRSGLLLAGVNNSNSLSYDDDGILTSLEISKMNFSNVDLVVLSACETGLGDILGSEGVFGLQRAFKIAGVNSLIVSLWQIPDKQTSDLMFKFYYYYLNGASKNEALKNAQNDIKKEYPEPYYWAGFELIE